MKVEKDPKIAHAEAESVALPIEPGAQMNLHFKETKMLSLKSVGKGV